MGLAMDGVLPTAHHLFVLSSVSLRVPGSINRHLRPYQRDGVDFLFQKYARNTGGILADDMGLVRPRGAAH